MTFDPYLRNTLVVKPAFATGVHLCSFVGPNQVSGACAVVTRAGKISLPTAPDNQASVGVVRCGADPFACHAVASDPGEWVYTCAHCSRSTADFSAGGFKGKCSWVLWSSKLNIVLHATGGWFFTTHQGALSGAGKEDEVAPSGSRRCFEPSVISVLCDMNAGSVAFYVDVAQHGPGYPRGVTGPLCFAVNVLYKGAMIRIVPNPKDLEARLQHKLRRFY